MILRPEVDPAQEILRTYKQAFNDFMVVSKRDPSRLLNLRCSQLPFCPHNFVVDVAINPFHQSLGLASLYYVSVGTTVHEVMQRALPQFSDRIVGNWLCRECGTIEQFTTQQECCGFPMQYEEVSIDYKGIQGHVDCLFKVGDGYYVVDFKTCSMSNRHQKEKDPGEAYKEQLFSYAWLLNKQHKLKILGVMNLFVPRDNPADPVMWSEKITPAIQKETFRRLKQYRAAHKAALNVKSSKGMARLWDEFGPCKNPYCKVCSSHDPKKLLVQTFKRNKHNFPLLEKIAQ